MTATLVEPVESTLRRQRLAQALRGLVADLAEERRRTSALRRENARLQRELDALARRHAGR